MSYTSVRILFPWETFRNAEPADLRQASGFNKMGLQLPDSCKFEITGLSQNHAKSKGHDTAHRTTAGCEC